MKAVRFASFLSLISMSLFAIDQEDQLLYSSGSKAIFDKQKKTINTAVNQEIAKDEQDATRASAIAGTASSGSGIADVMIVDPKIMAKDWIDAFTALQGKHIPTITFYLKSGAPITNISNVESMEGGYLLLFTTKTVQGPRYRIVKTSEITTLSAG